MKRSFNQPVGVIRHARMQLDPPQFIDPAERRRGRRAAGIRYERQVHEEFVRRYGGYIPSVWFHYGDSESDDKWCQTDGLLIDPWAGRIVVVEVKLQHTPVAYWQLFKTYLPVLQHLFGGVYEIACCEVVRWFDVATLVPVRPTMCAEVEKAKPWLFNVYIWR